MYLVSHSDTMKKMSLPMDGIEGALMTLLETEFKRYALAPINRFLA